MLTEGDLERTAAQLQKFQLDSKEHFKTQNEVLDSYVQLVEDYKRLKSDYEEARDSRDRYKQLARGSERNPFVLLLVDGDGYIFDDDLVGGGADGGSRAAQLLNDMLKSSLRSRGLEHCKITVRVYANLAGLSKAVSRSKLCGPEKRSLAPFTANFNRSNELFDFVDAGELKENADFKLRGMFRQFVENAQCKHIYFAAAHDVGYISELTPYAGNSRDRVTLVKNYAFHPEFAKLGLRTEEFPGIFRTGPLPTEPQPFTKPAPVVSNAHSPKPSVAASNATYPMLCTFFQKGLCTKGAACKFSHATNGASPTKSGPFQMANLAKNDNDFMSGHGVQKANLAALPLEEDIPQDTIPINKSQQRLDSYLPTPLKEEFLAFNARINGRKLCNNYHLHGSCPSGDNCAFDHAPITPGVLNCLKSVARTTPCSRRSACRSLTCSHGHVCQKMDCTRRGGKIHCKLPHPMHTMDTNVAEFVPATSEARENDSLPPPVSEDGGEDWQPDSPRGSNGVALD